MSALDLSLDKLIDDAVSRSGPEIELRKALADLIVENEEYGPIPPSSPAWEHAKRVLRAVEARDAK